MKSKKTINYKITAKVNYELLNLYSELGKEITEKQKEYSWRITVANLSNDLKKEFLITEKVSCKI